MIHRTHVTSHPQCEVCGAMFVTKMEVADHKTASDWSVLYQNIAVLSAQQANQTGLK
jgi:hypothetical protein